MQRSAWRPDRIGQHVGAAVVEQDQVKGARAVPRRHARPHRGVRVHPLGGGRARQELEEDLEVAPRRDELLDAHDRDQDVGQGQAHPAVALGLDDDDRAACRRPRSWRPETATRARRNFSRRCSRAASASSCGSSVRPAGAGRPARGHLGHGRCRGSRSGCDGSPGRGCATAGRARAGRSSRRGPSPRRRSPRAGGPR